MERDFSHAIGPPHSTTLGLTRALPVSLRLCAPGPPSTKRHSRRRGPPLCWRPTRCLTGVHSYTVLAVHQHKPLGQRVCNLGNLPSRLDNECPDNLYVSRVVLPQASRQDKNETSQGRLSVNTSSVRSGSRDIYRVLSEEWTFVPSRHYQVIRRYTWHGLYLLCLLQYVPVP